VAESAQPAPAPALTAEHTDRATFATSSGPIVISWAARAHLLQELKTLGAQASPLIDAIEAVGAARPVDIADADKRLLHATLAWMGDMSLAALRQALAADVATG